MLIFFRALTFLLLLLLLFVFLVCRVIPCILCDLFEQRKPELGSAHSAPLRGYICVPRDFKKTGVESNGTYLGNL
jgi:hypothetical protein